MTPTTTPSLANGLQDLLDDEYVSASTFKNLKIIQTVYSFGSTLGPESESKSESMHYYSSHTLQPVER